MTDHPDRAEVGSRLPWGPRPVTVLLLDDHAVMLESLRAAIEADDAVTVVGTASRVPDAIRLARITQPQVAVLDVNMPDGGGWAAAKGLREVCPQIRLIAYSAFEEAMIVRTIAAAGISAFVSKGSCVEELLAAIHGEDAMPTPPQSMPLMRRTTVTTEG